MLTSSCSASGKQVTFTSGAAVTANNASDPTSFLTCLGGAPLSGIHCSMGGMMSVQGPIKFSAAA